MPLLGLGQVAENVALLVDATPGHDRHVAPERPHGHTQALASVEDHQQHAAADVEAPAPEVLQRRLADLAVLAVPLPDP